ncbi:MAG: hypothetical protein KF713_05615 [Turneriella sp.]|nr:hypothetical protein [Turneriella sp.]
MILDKIIPPSYIIKKIRIDLIIVSLFSAGTFFAHELLEKIDIPIQIPAFLGTSISLVLAFMINQAYDRWWEARKIWGAIVNDSRTFVMQLRHFTSDARVKSMALRQIAWCYALGNSLRKLPATEGLKAYLSTADFDALQDSSNVPLAIADQNLADLSQLRRQNLLSDFQHIQVDSTVVRLVASMGKAERIKHTVFPKSYRVFLHLFIYIFLISLAFSMSDTHNFVLMLLTIVISLPFFLLEKTAYHMQDPFENRPTDISVSAIARTIEINIRELMGEKPPEPWQPNGFYLL